MKPLPTEIKIAIFHHLTDLSTVKCLSLADTSFNAAFLSAKNSIIGNMVKNSVGYELLPETVAVAKSFQIGKWSREAVLEILDNFFGPRPTSHTVEWDITTALPLYKLHETIEKFSADFAAAALAKDCLTNKGGDTGPPPTGSEVRQFVRTFWVFELYCNLFRDYNRYGSRERYQRFSLAEIKKMFFDRFAAFENEQLGCVHDYCWDQVSLAFDDVAAHDIEWSAEWNINWIDHYGTDDGTRKEALISRGLMKIWAMKTAQTYDERYKLVDGRTNPDSDWEFLAEGLREYCMTDDDEPPKIMTSELAMQSSERPSYIDTDDGPFEAWKWGSDFGSDFVSHRTYFGIQNRVLRQRAYVMWNKDRLDMWNLFGTPRYSRPPRFEDSFYPSPEAWKNFESSVQERTRIHEKGGLGWWSPGDSSRIEWPRDQQRKKEKERQLKLAESGVWGH